MWDADISCSSIPDIPLTVFPSGSESGSEVSDVGVPLNQQDSVVSVPGDAIAEGEEKQSFIWRLTAEAVAEPSQISVAPRSQPILAYSRSINITVDLLKTIAVVRRPTK